MPLNRRNLIASSLAAGLSTSLPLKAQTLSLGVSMRERANAFLASLNNRQRNAATFPFKSQQRKAWNFMLGSRRGPGLALEQMTAPQKDLAMELLATGTSKLGLQKAENIMLQQDILRDEWGKGSADRNRERFSVQIYGTPAPNAPWAWRWEGHHLSLTFTLLDDEIVSTTPSAFSSEPNTVPSGPHQGLVVLDEEEALGRAIFESLGGSAREAALLSEGAPGNIQSNAGRETSIASENAGVAVGDLPQQTANMIRRLVEVYTLDPLPAALSFQQATRMADEDQDALRFAWAGTDPNGAIYYRLTGETELIEFASLRNQPLHLHAVFHDVERNFGAHRIGG